jgi:DNA mismatch endonuclease (patch repair protein)
MALRERLSIKAPRPPKTKSAAVSKAMRGNKASGTKPELALRKALKASGLKGMRFNVQSLPGRPDVVFPAEKLAVFLNGCFWHRCPYCSLPTPWAHRSYWTKKFEANRQRDRKKRQRLGRMGYRVMTVWECRFKAAPGAAVERVTRRL